METNQLNPKALTSLETEAHRRFLCYELTSAHAATEHLISMAPDRPYPHYLMGEIARRRRDWDEAQRSFGRAHDLGRNDFWTLYRCGESAYQLGDRESAERWLHLANGCTDNDRTAENALASLLRFMGRG